MRNKTDTAFNTLLRQAGKSYVESDEPGRKSSELRLMLSLLGILGFVGNEPVRIFYRKNFGMTVKGWIRLGLCALSFAGIAVFSFVLMNSEDDFSKQTGTSDSHLISGIAYTFFTLALLYKGISDHNKTGNNDYPGDSTLLKPLTKAWSFSVIQNWVEPSVTLGIGILFCLFDRVAGVPIIFCSLSAWGYAIFDRFYVDGSVQARADRLSKVVEKKKTFHNINTD